MLNRKRSFSVTQKASIAYIISGIISRSINLLTMPLFTRWLTLEEMGITTTFTSWQTILYAIVSLSLGAGTVNAAMIEFKDKKEKALSSMLGLSTFSAIFFSIIMFAFREYWETMTSLPKSVILLLSTYFLLQPALDFWYAKNKFENKYISVTLVSSLSIILSGIVSIICIYCVKNNNKYNLGVIRLYAQYSVIFLIALIIFVIIVVQGKTMYDRHMWKWAICISWPLIIHSLSKNLLDISDRIMVANIRGNAEAALYGTVYTICNMPLILWGAINSAIIPYIFNELEKNINKDFSISLIRIIAIFGGIILVVSIISPEIIKILTSKEYYNSVYIMPPLFSSVFLTSLYNIYGNFLLYKKKTKGIMIGTIIAVVCNVLLNLFFISVFGYWAAAYTTLIASIILCVVQGIMCKYYYKKNIINPKECLCICGMVILFSLVSMIFYRFFWIRFFFFIIILYGIFKYGEKWGRNN